MVKRKDKKAEFSMSFNMLFSVILIAIFVALAIYVISYFFKMQCSISLGNFKDNLQTKVNAMWRSDASEESNTDYRIGTIGKNCVEEICFFNTKSTNFKGAYSDQYDQLIGYFLEANNLYFYPVKKNNKLSFNIEHLDTSGLKNNPQCYSIENGKVIIPLKKSSSDALVSLGEP